jgi:hypothetical protein
LAGHAALLGEMRNAYKVLVGKSEDKRLFGVGRDGRIILKFILRK